MIIPEVDDSIRILCLSVRSTHPSVHGGTESLYGKTPVFTAITCVDLSLGLSGTAVTKHRAEVLPSLGTTAILSGGLEPYQLRPGASAAANDVFDKEMRREC